MMHSRSRSRSRSRPRQKSSYRRPSPSRSPFYPNRDHYNDYHFRDNVPGNRDRDDRRRRNDFSPEPRFQDAPSMRSPIRHGSPSSRHRMPERKREYDYQRPKRSPSYKGSSRHSPRRDGNQYDQMYNPSPPQRLLTEPLPRENSIFRGPEGTVVDYNELKKITVDIRWKLPRGVVPATHGPLRFIFDPEDVVVVRRSGEGSRPIFDRDELKMRPVEERVIKLAGDQMTDQQAALGAPGSSRTRESFTPPPAHFHDNRPPKSDAEADLRYRLIEKKNNDDGAANVDPNFVPQRSYYFEHDNRERFNSRGRGGHRGGQFRGGGFRGGYNQNNHHYTNNSNANHHQQNYSSNSRGHRGHRGGDSWRGPYRGKQRSPDWKHDLYDQIDDAKPTSTTPME